MHINPFGLDWRRFLVAVPPGGSIIGCGQIKPHRAGWRELASLAVEPAFQGRGIGKALTALLMQGQKPPLYLITHKKRERYYERFGFFTVAAEQAPVGLRRLQRISSWAAKLLEEGEPPLRIMRWDGV